MAAERLQKLLARAGVASRRACEDLVVAGRVRVNGRVVRELGAKADLQSDRVELDGRRLTAGKPIYYVLNKPRAVVATLDDPEGRESIADLLRGIRERVFPVGRLDYHTSGALLLTNDGELAQALLHPRRAVPKTYVAKVRGAVDERTLALLSNGIVLDDGYKTRKADVYVLREERDSTWLQLTLREGKNRQIHRMVEAAGQRVVRLSRTEFAGITVEGLRPGQHRPLSGKELDRLKRDYLNPSRRAKTRQARTASDVETSSPSATQRPRPASKQHGRRETSSVELPSEPRRRRRVQSASAPGPRNRKRPPRR
ncbi:MAG: rRNA pseudouridine synthase [Proteobacteria bacterium]|nr:rRNA pseudouridine synthase [Pseudomonadota bacterium]